MQMFVMKKIDKDEVFGCKNNKLFLRKLQWRPQAAQTHNFGYSENNTILLQRFIGFVWGTYM